MFDMSKLAIIIVETPADKEAIPKVMENIVCSLFDQQPSFIVVSGEGKNKDLTAALNAGIQAAIESDCDYVFWAHPDMRFDQPNWHLPLVSILNSCPRCLKVCASNSRDPIGELRLDQEQSWMMRTRDFQEIEGLYFDETFKAIGGFEDWYQSWQIITSGYLVVVTPTAKVFHAGMGTRKLKDTVAEQQGNSEVYCKLTGVNENPHQWQFFGKQLSLQDRAQAYVEVLEQFPEFARHQNKLILV